MRAGTIDRVDSSRANRVVLSAEWRDLVMLNYCVRPDLLCNLVPKGTELDYLNGSTFLEALVSQLKSDYT